MISYSPMWNLMNGIFLALLATAALAEAKSSSLVSKALILWPALTVVFGILSVIQSWVLYGFSVTVVFGIFFLLCGIQAGLVNIRKLSPWPSGAIWLTLVLIGIGSQFYPHFEQRLMGFLWIAIGLTKVMRERSAAIGAGTPLWIQLLYLQAVLLAAYR